MPADLIADRLEKLRGESRPRKVAAPRARKRAPLHQAARPRRRRRNSRSIAALVISAATLATVPFLVFARGAVMLYVRGWSTTASILGAAIIMLLIVAIGATLMMRRFRGRVRFVSMLKWVALPLVCGWAAYALLFLASSNAKTADVRKSFTATHPLLRIALSTAILADRDLVITDMRRVLEDYPRMGLPVFDGTLHREQADGWVHAVDLRTSNHGELRNRLLQAYFELLGFGTLRHVGTADHLHVQLALRRAR